MTHLEIENLASDYLEGLLEPFQQAAIDAHLTECVACREMLEDVTHVLEMCRAAEDVEPKPWLVSKIMLATVGERKPTWRDRIAAYFRPVLQPRVAYPIAMTVFTFSIIVNAAGLNLRSLRFEDLNPRTWVGRANRQGHLMAARAEKFYYDLRVVYEIESRFRQLGGQPQGQEEEVPKPVAPEGGSSQGTPSEQTTASIGGTSVMMATERGQAPPLGWESHRPCRCGKECNSMKCANHPLNDAMSYCGQCGRSLCTECKRDVSGMVYCESCLATRLHSPIPPWGGVGTGPNPGVALALGFIPGVGAIYNGQITKAISQVLIFGCLIAMGDRVHGGLETVFGLGAAAFYFYMVIDSFQTAKAKSTGQPVPEWFGLSEMKLNAPVGAALLIGLGILFLLDNLGIPVINQIGKFWPVLLIVAGFLLLQRRLGGGSPPHAQVTPPQPEKPVDGPNNILGPKGM